MQEKRTEPCDHCPGVDAVLIRREPFTTGETDDAEEAGVNELRRRVYLTFECPRCGRRFQVEE